MSPWAKPKQRNVACPPRRSLERLESVAREAGRGLWAQPRPVPPWDWRDGRGVAVTAAVVGNKRSRVYHAPTCRGVAVMKPENRADFPSEAAAEEAGYSRAGDCQ